MVAASTDYSYEWIGVEDLRFLWAIPYDDCFPLAKGLGLNAVKGIDDYVLVAKPYGYDY